MYIQKILEEDMFEKKIFFKGGGGTKLNGIILPGITLPGKGP